MKRSLATMGGLLAVAGLLIAGCSKEGLNGTADLTQTPPAGVTNETQAMQSLAMTDAFVQNDELTFADQAVQPMDYGTFGKIDAAIMPLRWGRFITGVTKTVTTTVQGDTLAFTHVAKVVTGTLKIKGITGVGDTVTISKAFTDTSGRNIIFKRVAKNPKKFWMNWEPVASSLVAGGTFPVPAGNQISIVKVEFFLPQGDTITVTDPTGYYLRYRWHGFFKGGRKDLPELISGNAVRVRATVVSASADTDIVAFRYGYDLFNHNRRQRMAMVSEVNNGNNTFTREYESSWMVHFHHGYFNAGIDALTRATLYDDAAPYSVSWWGVPYRVN